MRSVRPKDIEEAIFRPNASVEGEPVDTTFDILKEDDREVWVYTILGKHDFIDEDDNPVLGDESEDYEAEDRPNAFAKKVSINGGQWRYSVRRSSNGRMLNPIGQDEGRHNKELHHAGRKELEFHSVNARAFKFYLAFLRTKNLANLRNAERETF